MPRNKSLNRKLIECGVSAPYASQIARGLRAPSLALAVAIYQSTGLKFGPIKNATPREIATIGKLLEADQ